MYRDECAHNTVHLGLFCASVFVVFGISTHITFIIHLRSGPNCYVNASRSHVIPAGEPTWVDSCTKCRCHDGQDAGYWEGNRLATCSRLKNCTP